jgi:adenylate cyclase
MLWKRFRQPISVLLVGLAAFVFAWQLDRTAFFTTIEGKTWDWRVRNLTPPRPPGPSVLVLIDEATLKWFKNQYQIRWPLPRDAYCPVLAYLKQAGAKAVVFDLQFSEPDAEFDEAFAQCIADNGKVVLAWQCGGDEPGPVPWSQNQGMFKWLPKEMCNPVAPVPVLQQATRMGGRVDMQPDPDGVLRFVRPIARVGSADTATYSLGLAALALDVTPVMDSNQQLLVRGVSWLLPADGRLLIRWPAPDQPPPQVSFKSVYAAGLLLADNQPPELDPKQFRDKIVIIAASAAATFEMRVTPVREADIGAHVHAAVIDALSNGQGAERWPDAYDWLATLFLAFLVAALTVLPSRLWQQVLGTFVVLGGWLGVVALTFHRATIWLPVVMPAMAILVASSLGTALNYATEGRKRAQIRHAFAHYLAPAYIEELVKDPGKLRLGGERREITAFFSDVQGFTTVSEKLDPATLVLLLNECLGAMTEIIIQEGGIIDKYIGDAIVAIFGAPLDQPDHAERAVRAALRCQQKLAEMRISWAARGLPELRARIGLNSGTAVVGNMGSQQRFDYTMMGDMVNLASRLESAASVYDLYILIGEQTAKRVQDSAVVRELDWLKVKGKKLPVGVATPLAMRGNPGDAQAVVELSDRALQAYRRQDFVHAKAEFAAILARWPDDGPAKVFLARIAAFEQQPPPQDWDGVHELTSK